MVVDDEAGIRESLRITLKDSYEVLCAESVDAALILCREQQPEMALVDIRMPDRDGFECLRELLQVDPCISVAMITAYASIDSVREAMKIGAVGFLLKPSSVPEIRAMAARGIERCRQERDRRCMAQRAARLDSSLLRLSREAESRAHLNLVSEELVHDLASPITQVEFSAEALDHDISALRKRLGGAWDRIHEHIEGILSGSRQCLSLVHLWRDVRNGKTLPPQLVRLSDILGPVLSAAADRCERLGIEIQEDHSECEAAVLAERTQVQRVINNIVQNAIDACPDKGGRIAVSLQTYPDRGEVELIIRDNGPGVRAGLEEKIFDPYFSTKQGGDSMGLGLFIARQVLTAHGATIRVVPGHLPGAAFRITFPIAKPPPRPQEQQGP